MKKRRVDPFLSLNALLGTYGVKTSLLLSNQDYFTCADALWPGKISAGNTLEDIRKCIKAMSLPERRSLAKKNISRVPSCFLSDADKHQRALAKALGKELAE